MLRRFAILLLLLAAQPRPARADPLTDLAAWPLLLEEQEVPALPPPDAHPLVRARAHRLRGAYGDAQAALDAAGAQGQPLAWLAERRLLELDRWTDPLLRAPPSDDWACAQSQAQAEYEGRVGALEAAGVDPRAQVLALWARQLGTLRTTLTPQQLGPRHAALEQRARRTLDLSAATGLLDARRVQALSSSLLGGPGWFAAARRAADADPGEAALQRVRQRGDLRVLRRALGLALLRRVLAGDQPEAQRLAAELQQQLAAHRDVGLALWLGQRYQQAALELAQGALRFTEARRLWQHTLALYQAAQLPVGASRLAVQVAEALLQAGAVLQADQWLAVEPPARCQEEGLLLTLRSDVLINRLRVLLLREDVPAYRAARAAARGHAGALEQALRSPALDEVDRETLQARRAELAGHLHIGGVWLSFQALREALVLEPQRPRSALVALADDLAREHGLAAPLVQAFLVDPLLGDRRAAQQALAAGRSLVPLQTREALVRYGAFAQALPLLRDARAPADRALLAEVRLGLQQPAEALALSQRVIAQQEAERAALFDERVRGSYFNQHRFQLVYETAVRAAAQLGDADALFASIEGGRAAGLREHMLRRARGVFSEEEALAQAILYDEALLAERRCGADARCDALRAELARLQRRYEERLRLPAARPLLPYQPPTLRAVQARLPPQRLLLDYFVTAEELVLLAIDRGAARVFRSPVLRVELEGRTLRLLQALSGGQEDAEDARWLADRLLPAPLREQLAAGAERELRIAAHGLLHEVPFASLPLADAPLVRRHSLALVPFVGADGGPPPAPAPGRAAVLVHAGADAPLPRALAEARQVAALYNPAAPLTPAAGAADLRAALEQPQVVHVVAHGAAQPQRTEARLVLRGGDVGVAEVLLWPRPLRAPLLVLSACELGVGRRALDDERVGLPRSLLLRGVGAVVASLWQLPDSPELLALMQALHQELRRHPPARALALAQRAALGHNFSPSTWAALTILQDPGTSSSAP